jgi:hypothetical protein
MCTGRFLKSFVIALVCCFSTFATLPIERARLSNKVYAHHHLADIKKLSKKPDESSKSEKFILKPVETSVASDIAEVESSASGESKVALSTDKPSIHGQVNLNIPAQSLWISSSRPPTLIDKTYLDAYTILRESNSCSRFFGGPRVATVVLNSLYPILETSLIENHVGITMSGSITFVTDFQTGVRYRLFKRALINLRGPFYQSANSKTQDFFHKIGYYLANTREARVTMLLHELGHLLRGPDGGWLLPDDGDSHVQVAANTATIMNKCSEQIKALGMESAP